MGRALLAMTLVAAACAGRSDAQVTVRGIEFRPATIQVEAGTRVTWVNRDTVEHTVTSGAAGQQGVPGVSGGVPPTPDGRFAEPLADESATAAVSFNDRGTYPYYCEIHAGMTGQVVVR